MNKTRSFEDALDRIADKLEELAGGGSSGEGSSDGEDSGSSDFSTAEVTFINDSSQSTVYRVQVTAIVDNTVLYSGYLTVSNESPVTVTVPLYKGSYQLSGTCFKQDTVDRSVTPSTTGQISLQLLFDNSPGFIITGDGTITATGNEGR